MGLATTTVAAGGAPPRGPEVVELPEADRIADALLARYRTEIRPLLEEHQVPGLEAVDRQAEVLQRARARKARLNYGFVGESQVGKSTLINALVGAPTLPAGGIGPLTAQATEVAYADEHSMSVRYHTRTKLNQLAFALERYLIARGDLALPPSADAPVEIDEELELVSDGEPEGGRRSEKGETFLRQARLMLTGSESEQSALSAAAIVAGVRAILGQAAGSEVADELAPHQARIEELRRKVHTTEILTENGLGGVRAFRKELRRRAAGELAPLVAELSVKMNHSFLRHATLVDLPGIGVVGDPAARVAEEFVRTKGDALIVVTRNSGLSTAIADLLERTGVITKLLFGATDRDPGIRVVIAVTHLDDVARDRYSAAVRAARDADERPPDRHALFAELAEQMQAQVRSQVDTALRGSPAFEDLPDDKRARRSEIVAQLCAALDVMIVVANDFLQLSDGQEDLAFLKKPEATGIPSFREHVEFLSSLVARRREEDIEVAVQELCGSLESHMSAIAETYEEGGGRARGDWERFRADLGSAAAPLREQMKAHHGEIIAILRSSLPKDIDKLCSDAEKLAKKKLGRLHTHGEGLHVQSLIAALRRGGVFERRAINYPDAITRAFVDSVATDWEPSVVEAIRGTMKRLADRDVSLVEALCAQAAEFDDRIVTDAHIEAQAQLLRQQARSCLSWTRERLEALREDVQTKLIDEVRGPIQRSATKALKAGANCGKGAKDRILRVFQEAGEEAIAVASQRATAVLRAHYDKLYRELEVGYLAAHHDPLQAAYDALTREELMRARRSDAQRRRRVLEQIEAQRTWLAALDPAEADA